MGSTLRLLPAANRGAMRVGRWSWSTGWAVIACSSLAGCGNEPPPQAAGFGPYQPATLAEAVVLRNATAIENFLALGVDPNDPEADGTTPLMRAVSGQMPNTAQLLISAGADVSAADNDGHTALVSPVSRRPTRRSP